MSKKINPYDRSLKILARLYPEIFLSLLIDPDKNIEVTVENPEINLPEKRGRIRLEGKRRRGGRLFYLSVTKIQQKIFT